MVDIFDAAKKQGFSVGIQIVAADEKGERISDTDSEWYGFDRSQANDFTMALIGAVEGVVNKFRENVEKAGGRKR